MSSSDKLLDLGLSPLDGDYEPLSDDEVSQLSELVGAVIPPEYVEFVSKYGGSHFPSKTVAVDTLETLPRHINDEDWVIFGAFFGGGPNARHIVDVVEILQGRMPESIFPFAEEISGNKFCIGVSGADTGRVYLWDQENEPDEDDYVDHDMPVPPDLMYSNLTLVAESFGEFLNRFREADG